MRRIALEQAQLATTLVALFSIIRFSTGVGHPRQHLGIKSRLQPKTEDEGRELQEMSVIAICGEGRIAVSALRYTHHLLLASIPNIRLVACPNHSDRGYDTWYPSLSKAARVMGIDIVELDSLAAEQDLLLLSLEYRRIVKVDRFASKRLFNLHFSRLPKYRGVYMATWPILNGETEAGVTLHLMDEGIDSGPIVDQRYFALPSYVTARSLYEMFMDEAFELFKENLLRLIYGDYRLIEQDHSEATYYAKDSIDFAQHKKLDLGQPAFRVERTARAFYFPEYQLPTLEDRPVRACHIIHGRFSEQPPGTKICNTLMGGIYVAGDKSLVELVWA